MEDAARRARVELFRSLCREQGERCTVQRLMILEAVLDLDNHPTADQVFDVVRDKLPSVAKPTVYRVLEHLARMGVITRACHPGSVSRYDPRVEVHHHLVCLQCNEFVDFEDEGLDRLTVPDTSDLDFDVSDFRVQLRGICSSCKTKFRKEELK